MTYRSSPPTLRITDPEHAYIACSLRVLGWTAVRNIARRAGCTLTEERIGLITKKFTARGDEAALQKFVRLAWNDADLGSSFRKELEALVYG